MSKHKNTSPFVHITAINLLSKSGVCKPIKVSGWKQDADPRYLPRQGEKAPIVWLREFDNASIAAVTETDRDAAYFALGQWGSAHDITVGEVQDGDWMYVIGDLNDMNSPHKNGFENIYQAMDTAIAIVIQQLRKKANEDEKDAARPTE